MQPRKGKRGRPPNKKAEQSDDQQSQSFSHKPSKKKLSKKNADSKKKDIQLVNKKSKSKVELSSVDSFSDSDENQRKTVKVNVQIFNSNQIFNDILNKANRQPQFLIMLKNLLSGCSRLRQDKKSLYRKKWKMLRNSNCTPDEYISRQNELKRMQTQEINQIQDDIINKLALANIRGFDTRQSIISNYKLSLPQVDQQSDYVIDENQWNKYREEQKKLLQILMNENDFVSQDYKLINVNTKYIPASQSQPNNAITKQEQNEMQLKFNSLQTEQNQQNIQFLFCKNYNNINYDKIFDASQPFKVSEEQKYHIDSKALSWLLQSKCDQIYTNEQFQKQTYNHYSKILRELYDSSQNFSQTEVMNNILQTGAYILNSVHYYQKFKLKCDLLHPLDLLLVTEKLNRDRNKKIAMVSNMDIQQQYKGNDFKNEDMIDQKQQEGY